MDNNIFSCPCCGNHFETAIKMKNHVAKMKDSKHELLFYFYKNLKIKCADLSSFYNQYAEEFDKVSETNSQEIKNIIVKNIEQRKERIAYEKEQQKLEVLHKKMEQIKQLQELTQMKKDAETSFFKNLSKDDKPQSLISYFYDKIHSKCYNYVIETKLIKGLYTKQHFEADTIRKVLDYMAMIGKADLRSINYCITDALAYYQYIEESHQQYTSAYFARKFYIDIGIKSNKANFVKEVRHIETTRKNKELTNEQVENIINGMVKDKVRVLIWFDSCTEKYKNKSSNKSNPCREYSEDREINDIVEQIAFGKMSLDQVSKRILQPCKALIIERFKTGQFNSNYNYFEFAYKAKLNLNAEMYTIAQKATDRVSRFDTLRQKANSCEKLSRLEEQKRKFDEWLKGQPIIEET